MTDEINQEVIIEETNIETNQEVASQENDEEVENQEVVEQEIQKEEQKELEPDNRVDVEKPGNDEAIVEGLLYIVGDDGAKVEQIALSINKSIEDTKTILENIQHKYASELYGIELVGYGSVYKFISKKEVLPFAQKLFGETKPNTLSQSALETLAIIAYKQPVTRIEIEELRGVGSEMMLRRLEARNLIREAGRSEAPGRPILYEVTEEFMDSFKLYTLNELPDLPEYNKQEQSDNLFE